MAQKTLFMNSNAATNDIRKYSAADFAARFAIFTTGVVQGIDEELVVTASGSNMTTTVGTGRAEINGYAFINDSVGGRPVMSHAAADATFDRIDRVIVRLDLTTSKRLAYTGLLTGVASATPTPPALTQNSTIWDIPIAQVLVKKGQSFIAQSQVTDERPMINLVNRSVSPFLYVTHNMDYWIQKNSYVGIVFNTIKYNDGGWTQSNHYFAAPETGYYNIACYAAVEGLSVGAEVRLYSYKYDQSAVYIDREVLATTQCAVSGRWTALNGSIVRYLKKGERIAMVAIEEDSFDRAIKEMRMVAKKI